MREECLNEHLFPSLRHACRMIAAWRADYKHHRPHSSLDGLTPREYHQRSSEDQNLNWTCPGKNVEHQLRNQEVFYGERKQTDAGVSARSGRLALTSGRTRREIADDLGIGLSTLTRWVRQDCDAEEPAEDQADLRAELKRLLKENAVLKQERDILKKAAAFFAKDASR